KEHDLAAAHSYFSQALLLAPDQYWSRLERGFWGQPLSNPSQQDTERRISDFNLAKVLRPDLPFASEYLYKWMRVARDTSEMKKELQELIGRFGLDVIRAHDMSDLLQLEGSFAKAEQLLMKVLDQDTGGWTA